MSTLQEPCTTSQGGHTITHREGVAVCVVCGAKDADKITASGGVPPGTDVDALNDTIRGAVLRDLYGYEPEFQELTKPSTLWDLEAYIGPAGVAVLMPVFGMARSGWAPPREAVTP